MTDPRLVHMAMPEDQALQAAIGRVAIRHGQMDYILRMTIKSICEVTTKEARLGTAGTMSGALRKRIATLANKRFGDCPALLRLQSILQKCRQASEHRNELLHGVFARELDGAELFLGDGEQPGPLPTVAELDELAAQLDAVTDELNQARRHGFLMQAITDTKAIKSGH